MKTGSTTYTETNASHVKLLWPVLEEATVDADDLHNQQDERSRRVSDD